MVEIEDNRSEALRKLQELNDNSKQGPEHQVFLDSLEESILFEDGRYLVNLPSTTEWGTPAQQ